MKWVIKLILVSPSPNWEVLKTIKRLGETINVGMEREREREKFGLFFVIATINLLMNPKYLI